MPILQQRLDVMVFDGTPNAKLNDALTAERFSVVSDDRGLSTPTGDGYQFASRAEARFRIGCPTRVALNWQQGGGQIFELEGIMHEGCW